MDEVVALRWSRALLVLLVVAGFSNTLDNEWHFDDFHSIVHNEAIRDPGNLGRFFVDPSTFSARTDRPATMYRPLLMVGYAVTHAVGGLSLPFWHVVHLALHLVFVLVVHALARSLGLAAPTAFLTAALLAIHPLQSQAVNYLCSRSEIQVSIFIAASLLAGIRADLEGPPGAGRVAWSVAFLVAGLLTKSVAVVVPVLLVVHRLWLGSERSRDLLPGLVASVRSVLPQVAAVVVYLLVRYLVLGAWVVPSVPTSSGGGGAVPWLPDRPFTTNLLVQATALFRYVGLFLHPRGLSICHDLDPSPSLVAWPAILTVPLVGVVAGVVVLGRRRWPLATFGGAFFLTLLVPTSLVPLHLTINEHRVYLASLGLALVLVPTLWTPVLRRGGRRGLLLVGGLLLAVCLVGVRRANEVWRTELSLWSNAALVAPGSPIAVAELAMAQARAGRPSSAVVTFELWCRRFGAPGAVMLAEMARGYLDLGQVHMARLRLEALLGRGPAEPATIVLWSELLVRVGRPERAVRQLESLAEARPGDRFVAAALARRRRELAVLQGRRADALRASRDDPGNEGLALAHAVALDRCGERGPALDELRAQARRWPASAAALVAAADLLGRDGRWAEALEAAAAAVQRDPAGVRGLELRIMALGALGRSEEAWVLARRLFEREGAVSLEVRHFAGLPLDEPSSGDWRFVVP